MASSGEPEEASADDSLQETEKLESPGTSADCQETTIDTRRNTDGDGDSQPTNCKRRKIDDMTKLCKDDELEKKVAEIAQHGNLELGNSLPDDQMRWLIVGICLHSIVTPALRQHVPAILQSLYSNLKTSDNIDTQTYPNILKKYLPTNKELNYEAINNNCTVRKRRNDRHLQLYNFHVQNSVDLSKLFLLTHMARFTGIDDTCDSSALLGMIINIDKFDPALQTASKTIRDDVRNPWAHCNFAEWDSQKYQNSFLLMEQIIQCLQLPADKKADILTKLKSWQSNGSHLMQGTTGFEMLKDLKTETSTLAVYCKNITITCDANFSAVHNVLEQIMLKIPSLEQRVTKLEEAMKSPKACLDTERNHFNPPNRTADFVGRKEDLRQLEQGFGAKGERSYTQVLCGLGGMGKTTLATEYSWRYKERYPGGVFWVLAESDDTLLDSFQSLAIRFGIKEGDKAAGMRKVMNAISLRSGTSLIVADNLDSDKISKIMAEFLFGGWNRDIKMHMIITSRREKQLAMETFKADSCIQLRKLTIPQGRDFITKRTGLVANEKTIENVVEVLGGLPLALNQAAIYIMGLRCSLDEYLQAFKKKRLQRLKLLPVLNRTDEFQVSGDRLAVQTTWAMNFNLVLEESEEKGLGTAAKTIMEMIAIAPNEAVYLFILNTGDPDIRLIESVSKPSRVLEDLHEAVCDELKKKQIIEILARFSIVDRERSEKVTMHRLVKEVVENDMTESHKTLLEECLSRMLDRTERLELWRLTDNRTDVVGAMRILSTNLEGVRRMPIKDINEALRIVCIHREEAKRSLSIIRLMLHKSHFKLKKVFEGMFMLNCSTGCVRPFCEVILEIANYPQL